MTYLEIIEWIESNAVNIEKLVTGMTKMDYTDAEGYLAYTFGKDLISIVLEINGKELVK